jgi:microcystin-dependent protein
MDYYLGQIGIFGFNFAPKGWAFCAGSILPIAQNSALYSLLGTTYGGNGVQTFALPDLRSRAPMDAGPQTSMGEMAGVENVTLLSSELPVHNHAMAVNGAAATSRFLQGNVFAQAVEGSTQLNAYATPVPNVALNAQTLSLTGGSQSHSNIQPCLAVNFCIAVTGYYPSRN